MTTPKKRVYYSKGNFVAYKNERYIVVSVNFNYLFTVYTLMNVTNCEIVLASSLDENLKPIRKRAFYEDAENMSEKQMNFIKSLEYKTGAKFNGRDMVDVDTFINLVKNANYSKEYKAKKLEDEVLGDVL